MQHDGDDDEDDDDDDDDEDEDEDDDDDDDDDEDEGDGERNLGDEGRSKPYEKPINSNYLHAFWSAGGGAGEIRRNEEMSTRAKTFHTNRQK